MTCGYEFRRADGTVSGWDSPARVSSSVPAMLSTPAPRRRMRCALAVAGVSLLAVLAACSKDTPASTSTGGASGTSGAIAPTTTAPATTTTTSKAPGTSTLVTTPGTSKPAAKIQLRGDGLGVVTLGDPVDPAIAALTAALGSPTRDEGWQPGGAFFEYPTRFVVWNRLNVMFADHGGTKTFVGWTYATMPGTTSLTPLASDQGVTLGQSYGDMRAKFGDSMTDEGFEGSTGRCFPDHGQKICATFDPPNQLPGDLTDASVISALHGGVHA